MKVNMLKFYEAYEFIEDHPAFCGIMFRGIGNFDMRVFKSCKHGLTQYCPVYVWNSHDRFEEFLGTDHHKSVADGKVMDIRVPYEEFYGYKWEFDHVSFEFRGGMSRYLKWKDDDEFRWHRRHDDALEVAEPSYEEAIIKLAELVKENYGDYSTRISDSNTIVPEWIVENNKKHPLFEDGIKRDPVNGGILRNPKNIHLKPEQINEIWHKIHVVKDHFTHGEKIDVSEFLK